MLLLSNRAQPRTDQEINHYPHLPGLAVRIPLGMQINQVNRSRMCRTEASQCKQSFFLLSSERWWIIFQMFNLRPEVKESANQPIKAVHECQPP